MKKIIIFLVIIFIIVAIIGYIYANYQIIQNEARVKNAQYESYHGKELYGTDLATLMNKAVDDNIKNHVNTDAQGLYVDNGENSIRIDIKFTDDDKVHSMEEIYHSGTDTFMQYYNQIRFVCTKIEHHNKTERVSYMYFEQIAIQNK